MTAGETVNRSLMVAYSNFAHMTWRSRFALRELSSFAPDFPHLRFFNFRAGYRIESLGTYADPRSVTRRNPALHKDCSSLNVSTSQKFRQRFDFVHARIFVEKISTKAKFLC
jgi:hypothetical protein